MALSIHVLGSGTSVGVPMIGCDCKVCTSADTRDQRTRASVYLEYDGAVILIDTTPDLRQQALRAKLKQLDAVVFTHAHADHIMGLDDIRPFNFFTGKETPLWADPETAEALQRCFPYVFDVKPTLSSRPRVSLHQFAPDQPFTVCGLTMQPIALPHGQITTYGFRFGNAAYLTDHNALDTAVLDQLCGLDVLFLDALRWKPHPTHSHIAQSLQYVQAVQPKRTYFTHISHDLMHETTQAQLPPGVFLSYDTLTVEVDG